jgi:hypothetical protein
LIDRRVRTLPSWPEDYALRQYWVISQVVILTVGAVWKSPYELYAHSAEARQAGLPDGVIEALVAGQLPAQLSDDEKLAARFAQQLTAERRVDAALYAEAEPTGNGPWSTWPCSSASSTRPARCSTPSKSPRLKHQTHKGPGRAYQPQRTHELQARCGGSPYGYQQRFNVWSRNDPELTK